MTETDIIVVGGGSAGCVVARRLAEDTGRDVVLLEAGPSDQGVPGIRSAGSWAGLLGGEYDWNQSYGATWRTAGRAVPIPRGRVLGGSSSINAMLWYRGHRSDYDAWEAAGATGWNYDSLLPYFRRSEDWQGGSTEYRGAGGPMRIETSRDPHPVAAAMLDGAAELGFDVLDDANAAENDGAALANLNVTVEPETGEVTRWSTVRGYLEPAAGWPNLHVLVDSPVSRLVFEGSRCVGVDYERRSGDALPPETVRLRARQGVVLTAGAIHTPRLLMLSGIGDPDELVPLGITVHTALRGVGKNLQDHPLLMGMNFRAREPLGPTRDNGGGSMLNWKSSKSRGKPDLHAFVVQGPHATDEVRAGHDLSGSVFAISPGLMDSRSVGYLRLKSADPRAALEIQPNYLAEQNDLDALIESMETIADLAATSAYRAIGSSPVAPHQRLSKQEKIAFIRSSCSTFFHACGTAAMGTGGSSVVSPALAVHGIDGLWVADASVFPSIPTSNTQAAVIAVAERASELIAETL
ncbi:GMC family oxidoreductase [Subtercola frigoramans]|uniref:Choline dehydrogenase n=1 Tax=Subtercola frigoramans TaxID=120298 RepID=A0ABS2L4X2_9MICO|nr:GMC family oxidoreductase N-terminal domain-containing protein [Subtercola frigoramans]MBM7472139.1 choline dehydrogenase [Subtercola frigoramans]